jgi:hypothetical protein
MSTDKIAYCGLNCVSCPIYLATRETDAKKQSRMREDIAGDIKKYYGMTIQGKDVNDCDGCTSDSGRLFCGCQQCKIRKCARGKEVENCAHCNEYACDELKNFFSSGGKLVEADAQKMLDAIRVRL